jgi:putative transposase
MTPQSRSVSSLVVGGPGALTPNPSPKTGRGGQDGAIAAIVRVGIPDSEPEGMPRREKVAIARCAYIQAQLEYCASREIAAVDCEYEFCQALKQGLVRVADWVGRLQQPPSRSTLCRWKTDARRENLLGMAPQAAPKRGTIIDSNEFLRGFIVGCVCKWPHVKYRHIYRAITARFPNADLTEVTVRRWVQRWKSEHHQQLALLTDPDGWKNRYLPAFGSYSEGVTALNDLWELDSTPADVMLADGRYAIVGCIDVYSRRAKLLVTKTSKATAIIALLRRCILDWGVPKACKTDNGKDYTAFHIEHTLEALGIEHKLCVPFSPEQKPHVERFLGTFLHDFLELLPGYIGHSVADRKQIESRKSFAERFGDKPLTVELDLKTFQVFCDSWCEGEYASRVHGSLGKSPMQMVEGQLVRRIESERQLDLLMLESVTRTVRKKGIRIDNRWFVAPELASVMLEEVHVRLSEDAGRVYVFTDSSCAEFVCVAEDPDFTGASRQAIARQAAQWKSRQREAVRQLRKLIDSANLDEVPGEVLAAGRAAAMEIEVLPGPTEQHKLPAASESAVDEFLKVSQPAPVAELTAAERAANEAFRAELEAEQPKPKPVENPYDRYLFNYYGPRKEGRPVDADTQAWVDGLDRPLRKQFEDYAEDLYMPDVRQAM